MSGAPLGVIEGFYGRPWPWSERERLVDFMAAHGFETYVYAPKDDPLHRASWRDTYLPEELVRFARLARRCEERGVEFVYGLSPLDLSHPARGAWETIAFKASQLWDVGIHSFCLLFDDMPAGLPRTKRGQVAAARLHARLANRLLGRVRSGGAGGRVILVPTDYHGRGESPYLRALGEALERAVDVCWTGPQVCSVTMSAADLRGVTRSLRRAPLIWDNYPVNDNDMTYDPHLRPIRGRAADLLPASAGLLVNPSGQPEASRIALHTFAMWATDPAAYDPESSWQPALVAVAEDRGDAAAVRTLACLARRSPIEPGWSRQPLPIFERFWADWETGDRQGAVAVLATEIRTWRAAGRRLTGPMANPRLRRDLWPWSRKLAAWALAADAGLRALGAARLRRPRLAPRGARARAIAALSAAEHSPYRVADEQFRAFVRRCIRESAAGPG